MDEEALKRISSSIKKELATPSYTRPSNDAFPPPPDPDPDPDYYHYLWRRYLYEYRERYMYLVLRKVDGASVVDKFVMALIGNTNLLERTSQSYEIADPSSIDWGLFLRKRLIESCFVIELFRKYAMKELREADDAIFNKAQNLLAVQRCLILNDDFLFLALVEFFNVTKNQDDPRDNFIDLVLHFFENFVGHPLKPSPNNPIQIDESKPLVDLVHKALSAPVAAETSITMETDIEFHFINYATELQEAGVKFKRMKGNYLEIKFQNGVLEIPPIKVAKSTTLFLLKRLMEYEQGRWFPDSAPRYVNDYVKFIQCLINSPKDVELLRRSGIIENWLGNDQLIFDELINLGNKSKISLNFTYSGIFKKVNEHCGRRRHVWMASLWRNYFNSPWSFISFIAAVVLLLLTLTQTVFSILSYHPS